MTPSVLEKHGCTTEAFKALATAKKPTKEFSEWKDRLSGRVSDGIDVGLRDWKLYYAMDLAYDVPFRQITDTLVADLFSGKVDKKEIDSLLKTWGITHLMRDTVPADGNSDTKKVLDLPVFFNIFVPLVKSYLTHRWGKIFNDRNVVPFFKFEPARFTTEDKLKCEIWTDVLQSVSNNMGIPVRMKQAYFQTLHYGTCLQFPNEAWYTEKQEDEDGAVRVKRQGIRFHFPHPTRVFFDPAYPATSFNTDTGCQFAGFWQVLRYSDVQAIRPKLWNLEALNFGAKTNWFTDNDAYFRTVYPCQLKFPRTKAQSGAGEMDREKELEEYTSDWQDTSVVVTQYYEKIIPADIGLGDYDKPVWFRILLANDRDILYGEPICYTPVVWRGYDSDENRFRNSSLTLDLLPFQDHLGNLITQFILSVKQNLDQTIFYDTEQLSEKQMEVIMNLGQERYRKRNWVPFSSKESVFTKEKQKDAIIPVSIPPHNTFEVMNAIKVIIDVMERSLGFSPQEVGQAASHEQPAAEVKIISENSGSRLQFTASFIDEGDYATMRQLYDAYQAYGDDDIFAQVTLSDGDKRKRSVIQKMGLEIEEEPASGETKAGIRAKKKSVQLDNFVAYRNSAHRSSDMATVTAMSQFVQALIANPAAFQAIGANQVIAIWNMMARASGVFPRDFEIHPIRPEDDPTGMAQAQQAQQVLGQMATAIQQMQQQMGQIGPAVMGEVEKAFQPIVQEIVGLKQTDQQTIAAVQEVQAALQAIVAQAQQAPPVQPSPEEMIAAQAAALTEQNALP